MKRTYGAVWLAVAALVTLPAVVSGQVQPYLGGAQARSLITQPVDERALVVLPGNTRAEAIAANDAGRVLDSFPMPHLLLQLRRPPELDAALADLIDEMHRPGSPQFHQWLTAADIGRRFGPSPQDVQAITAWLTTHGFHVDGVLPSGMVLEFSGTAGQVRTAFRTEIHALTVNGSAHLANMGDPQIPAALAAAVTGIVSLHDFRPHTSFKKRPAFQVAFGSSTYEAVAPADLATIYNLNPLFAAGITGVGQTVVVIEDTLLKNVSDVATFRTAFGLSGGSFMQETPTGALTCNNAGVNDDEGEAALDAEWAGAAAPGAAIVLAACANTGTFGGLIALHNLINGASPPPIVSISYGECEASNGAAANASYVSAYQQAAAEGTSVFVSSGDEGAASCDADEAVATHGIAVSGLASTPYNVAVGGTDFGDTYFSKYGSPPLPLSTYWNASNSSAFESAKSYIPEIPWNDSCAGRLLYSFESATEAYGPSGFCNSTTGMGFQTTASGSGGPSSYSAQPSWQTSVVGLPTASGGPRYLPDVSLFAANGVWGHFYVFCLSDTAEGGAPCVYTNATDTLDNAAGGTSFASPIMAGVMALVNQANGGGAQGNPNPRLYAMAAAEYGATGSTACNSSLGAAVGGSCFFNDVTLGDIDVNCTGTINCYGSSVVNSATYQGQLSTSSIADYPAYTAGTGWDYATGIGTVNVANLVHGWTPVSTTTTVTSAMNPSTPGASVKFTASIASPNTLAVGGTVTWSANTGCGVTSVTPGMPGVATCTTALLAAGADSVIATYSGDVSHLVSNGSVTQQVNPLAAPPSITSQPANQTVRKGQTAQFIIAASGTAPLAFQWQLSVNSGSTWSNLTNAPPYSGATTATLTVGSTTFGLKGTEYRCVATNGLGSATSGAAVLTVLGNAPTDFDGNGKADIAVYRPSTGTWFVEHSSSNYTTFFSTAWGIASDSPVPGDYDGDGKADIAVYRPSTGVWFILLSSTNYTTFITATWGTSTDIPLPGDYDGDGKTDVAIFRPSTGTWSILQSSTNFTTYIAVSWGIAADIPVPGDYDGDGKTDVAVFRPSTGTWWILESSTNFTGYMAVSWGIGTDVPVPRDYDGDGKTDPAVYRPSTGQWYILKSSSNNTAFILQAWGISTDIPVPGDYDGDGKADPAVFRPSTGTWFILESNANYTTFFTSVWGVGTDVPLPTR